MTTLKQIKQYKDKYCTKYVKMQIDLIKKYFKIKPNKRVFAFNILCRRKYFLCGNTVYIARFGSHNKEELIFEWLITEYNENLLEGDELPLDLPVPDYTQLSEYSS